MVCFRSQRTVFLPRMGTVVLSASSFPRVQAIVEPATITEVLFEVVYGHDTDFSGQPVIDFLQDVIFGFPNPFFYVLCIHEC